LTHADIDEGTANEGNKDVDGILADGRSSNLDDANDDDEIDEKEHQRLLEDMLTQGANTPRKRK